MSVDAPGCLCNTLLAMLPIYNETNDSLIDPTITSSSSGVSLTNLPSDLLTPPLLSQPFPVPFLTPPALLHPYLLMFSDLVTIQQTAGHRQDAMMGRSAISSPALVPSWHLVTASVARFNCMRSSTKALTVVASRQIEPAGWLLALL